MKIELKFLTRFITFLANKHPTKVLIFGYGLLSLIGWLLLCLPIAQARPVPAIDSLFMAVSNVSTTGLVTVSIHENYTFFGQVIIALLIQIGGLGYMVFASFIVFLTAKQIGEAQKTLLKSDLSLPHNFDLFGFVSSAILFTLVVEVICALLLYGIFTHRGIDGALWNAVFHSISIFCTAGFDLFGNSFKGFADDINFNLIVTAFCFLGGMGFIVIADVINVLRKKPHQLTYTTKVILQFTFVMTVLGTGLIYVSEPSIRSLPVAERFLISLFQSMTAQNTAGFSTVNIGTLAPSVLILLVIIMMIGASPSGTGGGIKSTTVAAVFAQMMSTLQGYSKVIFGKAEILQHRVRLATTRFSFYMMLLGLGIYSLTITEQAPIYDIIFEAASAMGTVGLTMGLTPELSFSGKLIVTVLMFIGRIGPLTLGAALFFHQPPSKRKTDRHDLAI